MLKTSLLKESLFKYSGHIWAILLFIGIALAYFSPVLQGKKIFQNDIVQYNAMAKERNDFRKERESYWTNSAFVGMPTYQLGAQYPYDVVKWVDHQIRFLPRPADYLFLYFISFYVLLLVLKLPKRYAFLGALAFGFSTYLIIILGVGHNAKAHAIGYFPLVFAGVWLVFHKRYAIGAVLTTFASALEISANHLQMSYYLFLFLLVAGCVFFFKYLKNRDLLSYLKSIGILLASGGLALALNATNLLATQLYAQLSTRGKSELTLSPEGVTKTESGLSKEYITEYSYGISESLNLLVPRLFGGANAENLGENSDVYKFLISNGVSSQNALNFSQSLPTYWGEQPIVAAPAYIGIVVFFLLVLALFVMKGYKKYMLLGGIICSLLLSWGKNFSILTDFMIDYFPLYDKFRAVSSIQVILEFCVPILAILGLYNFVKNSEQNKKYLYYSGGIVAGLLLFLWLCKGLFSFTGLHDAAYANAYGNDLMQIIIQDRKNIYTQDILRALVFTGLLFASLYAFTIRKLGEKWLVLFVAILLVGDLGGVDKRYVNNNNFVTERQLRAPFSLSQPEQEILQKDTTYFRVFNINEGLNGAKTSYFFHSVGGYHAAKPRYIQELFDYQIYKQNFQMLNMLNVKYLIQNGKNDEKIVSQNPDALGNAWFVSECQPVTNSDEAMQALTHLQPKNQAIVQFSAEQKNPLPSTFVVDSLAQIKLFSYAPDRLEYQSENQRDGFAVFSEMYYPYGWKATIDGEPVTIFRTDYLLRGLQIPAGNHKIIFHFDPEIIAIGSKITLFAIVVFCLLLLAVGYKFWKSSQKIKNSR